MTVLIRGSGSIGLRHARVLHRMGIEPIVWPVRDGRKESPDLQGFKVVSTLNEASRYHPRACIIATDTGRHLSDSLELGQLGCHFLFEKPIASSAEGLAVTYSILRSKGCHCFVGCNLRFFEPLQTFKRLLYRIGDLHSVRVECQSYLPDWRPWQDYRQSYSSRREEGGVLRDLIHEVDYAIWLFGRPTTVWGMLSESSRLGVQAEESADFIWKVPSGCIVSSRLDYLTRPGRRFLQAAGQLGSLSCDLVNQIVTLSLQGSPIEICNLSQARDDMMTLQMECFLSCLQNGPSGDLATFEEGAFSLACCDAVRLSSASKTWETIRDWEKE